jgi:ABC-type Fe3+-hydroxamate transport system substrate-binding protein
VTPALAAGDITVTDIAGRVVTVKQPVERMILGEGRQFYVTATLETDAHGRRPAGEITALLERAGFNDAEVRPLMDATLWLEAPAFPRYMVIARRP